MSLPSRPSVSLSMIVRNSAASLGKALDSIAPYVDEICVVDTEPGGSKDGTREIVLAHGGRLVDFPWVKDFSKARNFAFAKCAHDLVLWIDDDDVVINPEQFCAMGRAAYSLGHTVVYADYDYIHDRNGNCRTRHRKERFLDRRIYEWRGRVHETPCAKFLESGGQIDHEYGYVKHMSYIEDELEVNERVKRNLAIFEDMEKAGEIDHRYQFLYGNILRGIGKFEEALRYYRLYVARAQRSGQHYAAICGAARCLILMQKFDEQRAALADAMLYYPRNASAYQLMAQSYALTKDWDRALDWADEAIAHQEGMKYELAYDPTDIMAIPHSVKCGAYIEQGRFDEAEEELTQALKYYPDSEGLIFFQRVIDVNRARVKATDGYRVIQDQLVAEGRDDELELLASVAPKSISYLPDVLRHKRRPAASGKPTLGIFCPIDYEPWGPKSIETGIGGSETAAIQMANEMTRQGWEVTVYAHTRETGTRDGVHWNHYLAMNPKKDHHDVMLWWRDPRATLSYGMNCNVSIAWCHDVFEENKWIMEPESFFDKIFVLSEYHKKLFQQRIADDLLHVTRNGTDPAFWATPENQPHKIIYPSCPSRGLIHLLRDWSMITDAVDDAELHIYYGWNKAFEGAAQQSPAIRRIYTEIETLKKQRGVYWHGRVGKKELSEAFASSQVWAYPCHFPEISCITAMEAQVHGATPVINDYAALPETVRYGLRSKFEFMNRAEQVRYMTMLMNELKNPTFKDREEMISWARGTYSWEAVAKEWSDLFHSMLAEGRPPRVLQPGEVPASRKVFSQAS